MVLLLKPFGSEMPSSYSAGSQRANGVLEAPSRGFFLQPGKRSADSEGLLEKCRVDVHIARGARRPPFNRLQVVADAGDGAIHVDVGQGQALRLARSGRTPGDFGQFHQVIFREQIWKKRKATLLMEPAVAHGATLTTGVVRLP